MLGSAKPVRTGWHQMVPRPPDPVSETRRDERERPRDASRLGLRTAEKRPGVVVLEGSIDRPMGLFRTPTRTPDWQSNQRNGQEVMHEKGSIDRSLMSVP